VRISVGIISCFCFIFLFFFLFTMSYVVVMFFHGDRYFSDGSGLKKLMATAFGYALSHNFAVRSIDRLCIKGLEKPLDMVVDCRCRNSILMMIICVICNVHTVGLHTSLQVLAASTPHAEAITEHHRWAAAVINRHQYTAHLPLPPYPMVSALCIQLCMVAWKHLQVKRTITVSKMAKGTDITGDWGRNDWRVAYLEAFPAEQSVTALTWCSVS